MWAFRTRSPGELWEVGRVGLVSICGEGERHVRSSLLYRKCRPLPSGVPTARLERSIASKDPERTAIRVSNSLERVAALELLQAPGLPYQLPRSVAGSYPLLTGG